VLNEYTLVLLFYYIIAWYHHSKYRYQFHVGIPTQSTLDKALLLAYPSVGHYTKDGTTFRQCYNFT